MPSSPTGGTAGVDVLRKLDELGDADLEEAARVIANGGEDALEGAAKLESDAFQAVLRADIDTEAQLKNFRQFAGLTDETRQATFQRILRDEDLADSWLRVVSEDGIDTGNVRYALESVENAQRYGSIDSFYTGKRVQELEYPPSFENVYPENSIVAEFTLTDDLIRYRLYTEGGNDMAGRFLMASEEDIMSLSPTELQAKYAIPGEAPDAVATAEIPAGTTLRTGKIAPNEFGDGGGRQFTLPKSQVPDSEFDTNWFEKSEKLTQLLGEN